MTSIHRSLRMAAKKSIASVPAIFDLRRAEARRKLQALMRSGAIRHVVDDYEEQLRELFQVNHPACVYAPDFNARFDAHRKSLIARGPLEEQGLWIYYPWLATVVHLLPEKDFYRVRTARNKNLIEEVEQDRFYGAVIGIGGLSVGNSVATAIALSGGGRRIRLADHDHLALSNTNRVRAGMQNLGLAKVEVTARQIYEINPYASVELFPEGLTPGNIGRFFKGLDIVIDELDNLAVKYLIREQAKKRRIAVVMAADNGDNAVVDIERYDLDARLPFFHGRMGNVTYAQLKSLDKFGIGRMITKHIGAENVTERMQQSLLQMGKTIVSWPQLGGAALLNGSAVAYCVRRILNGQEIESNRSLISLDEKLIPTYRSAKEVRRRANAARDFKKIFSL